MGQFPKDQQQLAQDILAGRVTIQQLRAEQARRRAAQEALRQNMRPHAGPSKAVPAQPQSPRQGVATSTPSGRPPAQRQVMVRPDNTAELPATARKNTSPKPARKNMSDSGDRAANEATLPAPATVPAVKKSTTVRPPSGRTTTQTVRAVMAHPSILRSVLVLSELLGKPLSMRPDHLDRF